MDGGDALAAGDKADPGRQSSALRPSRMHTVSLDMEPALRLR
jgi:hypothetical protein